MATINGTSGSDRLVGTNFDDTINAFDGQDIIIGSRGFDFINGGNAADTVSYAAITNAITLKPAGEIDKGASGNDTLLFVERVIAPVGFTNLIDASTAAGNVSINASLRRNLLSVRNIPGLGTRNISVSNFASIIGTNQNDVIEGNNDNNVLSGLGGNDVFQATQGFDNVNGGDGFDVISYAGLNTAITIKPAGEVDKGALGSDSIFRVERVIGAANQANKIDASSASDVSIFVNLPGRLLQVFGIPNAGILSTEVFNFVDVIGTQTGDAIVGSNVNNFIDGQNGDDFITASVGNDTILGGDGFDTIDYSVLNAAVTILPGGTVNKGGTRGIDTAFRVEKFIGAAGKANTVNGATASVGIFFDVSLAAQFLNVFNVPGIGQISQFVENFANVVGTRGDDFIEGSSGNNVLDGGGGSDDIFGGEGNDTLTGGAGNDFITGEGGSDRINGTNSSARGRNEIDTLIGGEGSDRFVLGDANGSFYKATSFPSSDFGSFGFGGFAQAAFIQQLDALDRLELGRGETYQARGTAAGFDLYVGNSGRFDAVASVTTTAFVGVPSGDFSLAAGQTLGVFIGA